MIFVHREFSKNCLCTVQKKMGRTKDYHFRFAFLHVVLNQTSSNHLTRITTECYWRYYLYGPFLEKGNTVVSQMPFCVDINFLTVTVCIPLWSATFFLMKWRHLQAYVCVPGLPNAYVDLFLQLSSSYFMGVFIIVYYNKDIKLQRYYKSSSVAVMM